MALNRLIESVKSELVNVEGFILRPYNELEQRNGWNLYELLQARALLQDALKQSRDPILPQRSSITLCLVM